METPKWGYPCRADKKVGAPTFLFPAGDRVPDLQAASVVNFRTTERTLIAFWLD